MSLKLTKVDLSPNFSVTLKSSDFNYRDASILIKGRYNQLKRARLGYSIPKRGTKLAVRRNRLKRIVKEIFRLNADQLPSMDVIVLVQQEILDGVLKKKLNSGFIELIKLAVC